MNEYEMSKSKFLKIYANIPIPLRVEIVAVIDDESLSWAACRGEIENNTKRAPKILDQLKHIGVL
ncbi:hypothetical protein HYY74_06860 [Candidatus Woesearchaeota archaeon]|nr:hypothetical protein [Candidatus Woesearchaeota archaeon]